MSAIVRETSEYVEMSDSITLCIVKDGEPGTSAVTYGVQVSSTYETWSDAKKHAGIKLTFTKTTGTKVLSYENVQVIGSAKVYADGTEVEAASDYVNRGNNHNTIIFDSYTFDGTNNTPFISTASVITIELIVDDTVVATANYADGKQGADGKGALEIVCDPETITLDTDDNGLVTGLPKMASLKCVRDGKEVTGVTYKTGNAVNCSATVAASGGVGTVSITRVSTQTVTVDSNTIKVSATSGSVTVTVTETATGTTYTKTVPFTVNVARYTGGLKADNKKLQSQYSELTNNGTVTSLTEYKSEILQTAREISLKVSEKQVGRRNLLTGSALRKQDEGCYFVFNGNTSGGEGIVVNDGIDGVNALKVTTKSMVQYSGVFWGQTSGSPNIKIKRNAKYTASVWVKCSNTGAAVSIEMVHHASANDAVRHDWYGYTQFSGSLIKAGEWQLLQQTVSTGADYDYTECNFWATSANGTTVLFCKPMLEEGEEYNGWTLSEQDYDYVGGNMLDATGTLTKTGNVRQLLGTVTQGGYNNESAMTRVTMSKLAGRVASYSALPSGASVGDRYGVTDTWYIWERTSDGWQRVEGEMLYNEVMIYNCSLENGKDYVLSWMAKGTGRVGAHVVGSSQTVFGEHSDGAGNVVSTYGAGTHELTTQWKRYWMHVRPISGSVTQVYIRQYRNDDNTASECCIARPKLEAGATMTEWTERSSDMVDKRALLATGIDIDSRKITLTADNTTFLDNRGGELAVIDQDGLRASKIATTDTGTGHTVMMGNSTVWYQKDGVTPGIAVYYDAAGVPHFQFCKASGEVAYDLGPSGLQSFINDMQKAYCDTCYIKKDENVANPYVSKNGSTYKVRYMYTAKNAAACLRYIFRKQVPTTDDSKDYDKYDGCALTTYRGWQNDNNRGWPGTGDLVGDGWYTECIGEQLPIKLNKNADEDAYDPTAPIYYQDFYYYENGKRTKALRAYFKLASGYNYATNYGADGKYTATGVVVVNEKSGTLPFGRDLE